MKANFWVKVQGVKKYGKIEAGKVEVRKSKPDTDADEVAFKVNIEIPDSYFQLPQITASIKLPDNTSGTRDIPVEVSESIEKEIQKQTGFRVRLSSGE